MELDVNNFDIGGYDNSTRGFSSLFKFPNRNNREHRYFVAFQKQFSSRASDSIQVGYELINNSYPLQPGPNDQKELEELGINTRYLYNNLIYQLTSRSVFQVETKFQDRDFTQSNQNLHNHRQGLNFANRIGYRFASTRFLTAFSFVTSQNTNLSSRRTGGSQESRTDIDGLQSALNLLLNWRINPSDEAQFSFSYTKYEYSSPDTAQTIDEDDIRFIADMYYQHKFSRYFSIRFYTNLYFYHQIYIHPSRSINNNWNRIFQLATSFNHKISEVFQHNYQIKILANYTIYDFEDLLPEARSYIFRKLIFTDTLRVGLTSGLKLQTIYQLEKEDNGTFFKEIFAQQISRERLSHLIDVGLIYFRIKGFELTTAINWYIRKEWTFLPEKTLIRDYISISPRLSLLYHLNKRLDLYVSLAPRSYQDLNTRRQYFTMGRINLRYFF
jgi:DNA-binding XRE family transcriptional regulator